MTPIQFTGDITIIERATKQRCERCNEACKVGLHIIFPGQWLIEDGGFRVLDNAAYLRWKAEREVAETLVRYAVEMAA